MASRLALQFRTWRSGLLAACAVLAVVTVSTSAVAQVNTYCGSAVTPSDDPTDLAHAVGDQSLQYVVEHQPANINSCSKGYILAKCGDFVNANRLFDKCVKAGYAGAMIWKALLLEDGKGVEPDPVQATQLLYRAATSGDPGYGPIGKMHYATALYYGRGVQKNQAEALKWFREAAAEGNQEAQEFLKTGYHTGVRDLQGMGAGTPTAAALAQSPNQGVVVSGQADTPTENAAANYLPSQTIKQNPTDKESESRVVARKLLARAQANTVKPLSTPPAVAQAEGEAPAVLEVAGQKLKRQTVVEPPKFGTGGTALELTLSLLCSLLIMLGLGMLHRQFFGNAVLTLPRFPHQPLR